MSVLTYNGITLGPYGLSTQRVTYEPVYDPTGGVDYLYTKVTIAVTATFGKSALPIPPAQVNESPEATMARVAHMLQVPRRGLLFQVGADTPSST
jgi:hypothetical protein